MSYLAQSLERGVIFGDITIGNYLYIHIGGFVYLNTLYFLRVLNSGKIFKMFLYIS